MNKRILLLATIAAFPFGPAGAHAGAHPRPAAEAPAPQQTMTLQTMTLEQAMTLAYRGNPALLGQQATQRAA
ncbi:hypothetical protein HUK84_18125, partial [Nguyenibacter vanlangensis]|nr:hypothetical protein [Nguyenibacter vanlangensis]